MQMDSYMMPVTLCVPAAPALDLDFLMGIIQHRVPLDWGAVLASDVPLKVVASCLDTLQPVILQDFTSAHDLGARSAFCYVLFIWLQASMRLEGLPCLTLWGRAPTRGTSICQPLERGAGIPQVLAWKNACKGGCPAGMRRDVPARERKRAGGGGAAHRAQGAAAGRRGGVRAGALPERHRGRLHPHHHPVLAAALPVSGPPLAVSTLYRLYWLLYRLCCVLITMLGRLSFRLHFTGLFRCVGGLRSVQKLLYIIRRPACRGGHVAKLADSLVSDLVKRLVLNPEYMRAAWMREVENSLVFGMTTDEMLVAGLAPGSHALPHFAGTHCYPLFPGAAAQCVPPPPPWLHGSCLSA